MQIRKFTTEDYPAVVSIHNSLNIPCQSAKLGYARDPEWIQCQKDIKK
jgi:hypothetical protein